MDVEKNLSGIRRRIQMACKRSGRNPHEIKLMAVTKERTIDEINTLSKLGLRLFGENRVQEANKKWITKGKNQELHMIGHLQTNKAKEAISIFDVIESVDSIRLLSTLHKEAAALGKIISVMIQMNVSEDPQKFGILPRDYLQFFREANPILTTGYIRVAGLMTIVEHTKTIEERRPSFKRMKLIYDELRELFQDGHIEHVKIDHLSMGMSEDFEIAIEEGSTLVRIGRALFE